MGLTPGIVAPRIQALLGNPASTNTDATPALTTTIAMPDAPGLSIPGMQLPVQTQTDRDTSRLNYLKNSGSGLDQITNPVDAQGNATGQPVSFGAKLGAGIARAVDIAGSVFAPNIAQYIPGTTLHHNLLVNQQEGKLKNDQANDTAGLSQQDTQAQIAERQAQTEATQQGITGNKVAAQKAAMEGSIVKDGSGKPIAWTDGQGVTHAPGDPAIPAGIASVMSTDQGKPATSEFELWHKQNPTGTAEQFNQLQSKPLSQEQADALNKVWDGIAGQHHLPTGQFTAGMPHADAAQLAGSMNQAIGKGQGDVHITLAQQAAATKAARDPGTESEYKAAYTDTNKQFESAQAQIQKIEEAKTELNGGAVGQAVGTIKTLSGLAGGQGTGVRITGAELNALIHARGLQGDFDGWLSGLEGKGNLPPAQLAQMKQVLSDVEAKAQEKQKLYSDTLGSLCTGRGFLSDEA